MKCQILAERNSAKIICLFFGDGSHHDFRLFKASGVQIHPETESLQDSGYQGIRAYHLNSYVPKKKPKNGNLTQLERDYNHALSKERIGIEQINRSLKVFKIIARRYRNRRCRYNLRCKQSLTAQVRRGCACIAALYNYELPLAV